SNCSSAKLRVLLWSPKGSGLHYGGPGMAAYKLYSTASPTYWRADLAHGYKKQPHYPVFNKEVLIAPLRRNATSKLRFLRRARSWLKDNYQDYDVFHGLQGVHATVLPALWAQELGMPAAVKLAA